MLIEYTYRIYLSNIDIVPLHHVAMSVKVNYFIPYTSGANATRTFGLTDNEIMKWYIYGTGCRGR